jgi:hypothetical protein
VTSAPHRELVTNCDRRGTYKYFFPKERVLAIWRALEECYGPIQHLPTFGVMEIHSPSFLFRATKVGNPITVIRFRSCSHEDVARMHQIIGFPEEGT